MSKRAREDFTFADFERGLGQLNDALRWGNRMYEQLGPSANALATGAGQAYDFMRGPRRIKAPAYGSKKKSFRKKAKGKGMRGPGGPRRRIRKWTLGRVGRKMPKRAKKRAVGGMQRQGYLIEYETGGAISDPQAVYIAHGIPTRVVLEAVCGGITRKVLRKFGLEIKGWEIGQMTGNFADKFVWNLQKQATQTAGITSLNSATIAGDATAIQLALALADLFMNSVSSSQRFQEFVELRCLWTRVPVDVADYREEYRVMLSDLNVSVMCKNTLTMQNRTEAVKAQVTETDQTNTLDIAHNPLMGRVYYGKTTQINMKSMNDATVNDFLAIDRTAGFDVAVAGGANTTAGVRKLPYWNDLTNVYGSTGTTLKAGEIRDSVLTYSKKYKFARLMQKLLDYLATGNTSVAGSNTTMFYWPARMFGFEKKLDSRTSGQPDIVLAYQINYVLGAAVSISKRNAPLRVIGLN